MHVNVNGLLNTRFEKRVYTITNFIQLFLLLLFLISTFFLLPFLPLIALKLKHELQGNDAVTSEPCTRMHEFG